MNQFALDLSLEDSSNIQDFFVTKSNEEAFHHINSNPETLNNKCLILTGEEGSGKTHLCKIWQERNSAKYINSTEELQNIVENTQGEIEQNFIFEINPEKLSQTTEDFLFHLYNKIQEGQGALLVTSPKPIFLISFKRKDLKSRLSSSTVVAILPPDDELLKAMFFKLFSDRQIAVSSELIEFLIPRMERNYKGVLKVIDMA